jgi:hypothetical protein
MTPDDLQATLAAILERNARVEQDKAWEGSWARRCTIALLTYATSAAFLWFTTSANPLLGALFPPTGYLLSTLSLPFIRRWWLRRKD